MFSRRKITILLVAHERLVRADFSLAGKRLKLRALWQRPRPDMGDPVSLVEAALRQGGKRPGRTLVLSSDLWTQTIRMASGNCIGLSDDELSRALGFEAEPLSGIGAFDSMVAFKSMPADGMNRDFWIVQAAASQVDDIEAVVRQAGGRLLAVTHPAGVPRALASEAVAADQPLTLDPSPKKALTPGPSPKKALTPGPSPMRGEGGWGGSSSSRKSQASSLPPASSVPQSWQRIELWPTAIFGIHGAPGRPPLVHVVPSNPSQRGWESEMEKWRAAAGEAEHVEWLLPDASLTALAAERTGGGSGAALAAHHLDQEESLRVWLAAWAAEAFSRTPAVPLVYPTVRPMSTQRRLLIASVLAGAVGAACLGHYVSNTRATADLVARTAEIKKQTDSYKELQKQQADAETKLKNAQTQLSALRDKIKYCVDTLAAHRLRWKRLLELLAEFRPGDLVVQRIDGAGQKLSIHGLCLGPHPANELASNLGDGLRDLEWQVQPAKQQSGKVWAKGEPWKFELVVRELPLPVPAALAPPSKKPVVASTPAAESAPPAGAAKADSKDRIVAPVAAPVGNQASTKARRDAAQD